MLIVGQSVNLEQNKVNRKGVFSAVAFPENTELWENPSTLDLDYSTKTVLVKEGANFVACTNAISVVQSNTETCLQVILVDENTFLIELVYGSISFTTTDEEGNKTNLVIERYDYADGRTLNFYTTDFIITDTIDVKTILDYARFPIATKYGYATKDFIDEGYFYNSLFEVKLSTIYAKAGKQSSSTLSCKIVDHAILGGTQGEEGAYEFVDNRYVLEQERQRLMASKAELIAKQQALEEERKRKEMEKFEEEQRIADEKAAKKSGNKKQVEPVDTYDPAFDDELWEDNDTDEQEEEIDEDELFGVQQDENLDEVAETSETEETSEEAKAKIAAILGGKKVL